MSRIISHAFAKVNLMLNITEKTNNGYHVIESVFAFLKDIFDILEFDTTLEFNENSGNIKNVPDNSNSIKKAAKILADNFTKKIPDVTIKKNLPIASGIGGGSSDAACFINTVFDIWKFSKQEKLEYIDIFNSLGSDAKVFLYKYFTDSNILYLYGTGITGEIRQIDITMKSYYILLVNNGTQLFSRDIFKDFQGKFCHKIGIDNINIETLKNFHNSLQYSAIKNDPSLEKVLKDISITLPIFYGISGSGSSCFGIYDTYQTAKTAKETLNYDFVKLSRIL